MMRQKFLKKLFISKILCKSHIKKLHLLQGKSANKVIQELASDISTKARVVCIDEFEIKDITDAMIIMRLFRYLLKNEVFIFLTTDTIPDNLYKDGMQTLCFFTPP